MRVRALRVCRFFQIRAAVLLCLRRELADEGFAIAGAATEQT